jgi:hypothetical protein
METIAETISCNFPPNNFPLDYPFAEEYFVVISLLCGIDLVGIYKPKAAF